MTLFLLSDIRRQGLSFKLAGFARSLGLSPPDRNQHCHKRAVPATAKSKITLIFP
jgi:hypothetical protein